MKLEKKPLDDTERKSKKKKKSSKRSKSVSRKKKPKVEKAEEPPEIVTEVEGAIEVKTRRYWAKRYGQVKNGIFMYFKKDNKTNSISMNKCDC